VPSATRPGANAPTSSTEPVGKPARREVIQRVVTVKEALEPLDVGELTPAVEVRVHAHALVRSGWRRGQSVGGLALFEHYLTRWISRSNKRGDRGSNF
jgi:hypothetical protein